MTQLEEFMLTSRNHILILLSRNPRLAFLAFSSNDFQEILNKLDPSFPVSHHPISILKAASLYEKAVDIMFDLQASLL